MSWFHFKNETSSRILKHETTKCNLQTAIYYGDFGILQKTKFFGFIFMKLQFRCKNHASYLNFSSTLMKLSENFRLLYIEIVFDAKILWRFFFSHETFYSFFHSFIFFLQFHFFVKLVSSFIFFSHSFFRKNTSFWPVFCKKMRFQLKI